MININEKMMLNDLTSKIKIIKSNSYIDQINIKDITIQSEKDLSDALEKCIHDKYSDIDILIKCSNNANVKLENLGISKKTILGIKLEENEDSYVVRLVQKNGIRYDIVLFDIDPENLKIEIDEVKKEELFIAILALGKLMRKDYLISAHLAHLLCMETLVHQMKERDLKYNTNFHRYGYREKLKYLTTYKNVSNTYLTNDETYNHIAKLLISGIENSPNISDDDKRTFYEIWNDYIKQ